MKYTIIVIFFLFYSLSSAYASDPIPPDPIPPSYTKFVKTKCNGSTYPSHCIKTLSPLAATVRKNSFKLCIVALNVSIEGAKRAAISITRIARHTNMSNYQMAALKDCVGQMKDVVYEINRCLAAMKRLKGPDKKFQWATAQTRASAAITDAETCKDGMSKKQTDPAVRNQINRRIAEVRKRISNALYLINNLYQ